jgi:hypothetical protein
MSMKIKDQTQITNNYIWTSLVYLFKSLLFKKKTLVNIEGFFTLILKFD